MRNIKRIFWLLLAVSICFSLAPSSTGKSQTVTLDRVMATVGRVAITQSDAEREYRLERFLSTGRAPSAPASAAALKAALARLIDREVLAGQLGSYRINGDAVRLATENRMAEVKEKCGGEAAFEAALTEIGMNNDQLSADLATEEQILAMIDRRLRPEATVEEKDVEAYYRDNFLPAYARSNPGSPRPPIDQVRLKIREVLVQKKINQLLDGWLAELKKDAHVEIVPDD